MYCDIGLDGSIVFWDLDYLMYLRKKIVNVNIK